MLDTQDSAPAAHHEQGGLPVDEAQPILEVRGVSKRYGSLVALRDVDLDLRSGEVLAIVGDNGAGKSTLLKIISGNTRPSAGELLVDGVSRDFRTPNDAADAGIATVYQDLALALDLDVVGNVFLGRELIRGRGPVRWARMLDRRAMTRQTCDALERVHIRIPDVGKECAYLSGGQRQAVAIARAVTWCDRILLLDEPTAALGVEQQREVLNLIRRVRDMGIATILVSHQLPHVMEIADRIAVLRRGSIAGMLHRGEASSERLLALITGLEDERTGAGAPDAREGASDG